MADWLRLLATAPEDQLMNWQWAAMRLVELFERRKQTVLCRLHGIAFLDLKNPGWGRPVDKEQLQDQLKEVVALAQKHDVTLQQLEDAGNDERYEMLHLGTHGMQWPEYLKKRKKRKEQP